MSDLQNPPQLRFYLFYQDNQCYYTQTARTLTKSEISQYLKILNIDTIFQPTNLLKLTEVGPRLGFQTPWSSHMQAILNRANLGVIERVERSRFIEIKVGNEYDPMTEMIYANPLRSFDVTQTLSQTPGQSQIPGQSQTQWIPVSQVEVYNRQHQLGFDEQDLQWYRKTFKKRRSLSDMELYDLAQSNSEHSRHWLFNARILRENGTPAPATLFQLVKSPLKMRQANCHLPTDNSLIAFRDNSSAIRGHSMLHFQPTEFNQYVEIETLLHPTLTVETHNFPTGIAPFPGASTGSGGRIRDQMAVGRGGLLSAGTVGYCVGNLNLNSNSTNSINSDKYPRNLTPVEILIQASNGASDYGNKLGEPLIQGFARSFGQKLKLNSGKCARIEWIKPIMLSGGIGQIKDRDLNKAPPELGFLIVRLGGPTYRIGVGGGSASSRPQEQDITDSDLSAVQRPDPEMENRLYRVVRTFIESEHNPILSIHDQGAGGMANVTKEIVSPLGGLVSLGNVNKGDRSLIPLEIWVSESQEQNTALIHPRDITMVKRICARENLPIEFLGVVTNTGQIQVYDPSAQHKARLIPELLPEFNRKILLEPVTTPTTTTTALNNQAEIPDPSVAETPDTLVAETPGTNTTPDTKSTSEIVIRRKSKNRSRILNSPLMPVDLNLSDILENVPFKTFNSTNSTQHQVSLKTALLLPNCLQITELAKNVWSQLEVGSKRFLVNKVDRSVGGLVVQQQTVGPFETPISNYAIVAQSFQSSHGIITAQAEQPIKMLLDPEKGARLTVGEMLTNLIWTPINGLGSIKCSGNWMWEKRYPEQIGALRMAVQSLSKALIKLNLAIDGGKDSLSMSATVNNEVILSPRSLVLSAYATTDNFNLRVTPDLKGIPIPQNPHVIPTVTEPTTISKSSTIPDQPIVPDPPTISNSSPIPDSTVLIFVDLAEGFQRLAGSALAQSLNQQTSTNLGSEVPDFEFIEEFQHIWNYIQHLIAEGKILSGHDRSDGGLITTIAEMAMAGNCGLSIDLSKLISPLPFNNSHRKPSLITSIVCEIFDPVAFLFNEELGLCLEFTTSDWSEIGPKLAHLVPCYQLCQVVPQTQSSAIPPGLRISHQEQEIFNCSLNQIRSYWEKTSHRLDQIQANRITADQEFAWLTNANIQKPQVSLPMSFWQLPKIKTHPNPEFDRRLLKVYRVAVVREQGSNGDREMAQAFYKAGFQVYDLTTSELLDNPEKLIQFHGIAWVGGFSFADVLGAGRGWALSLTGQPELSQALDNFRRDPKKFSLGICNGAQLLSQLGWVPGQFLPNFSKRFESRFIQVKIPMKTQAVLLKGLENTGMGVWVAHGEGRFHLPNKTSNAQATLSSTQATLCSTQVGLHYIDPTTNQPAEPEQYPHNPNGSYGGIAGVCSSDGRHLAMMPHPERSIYDWQVPWTPPQIRQVLDHQGYKNHYPWVELFRNAYRFVDTN